MMGNMSCHPVFHKSLARIILREQGCSGEGMTGYLSWKDAEILFHKDSPDDFQDAVNYWVSHSFP